MDRDSSPSAHTPQQAPRPLLARLSLPVIGTVGMLIVVSVASMVAPFFAGSDDPWLEHFERLELHAGKETVRQLLGEPPLVEPCAQQMNGGRCESLWRYGAHGSLSAYGVGFDVDGRVVGKYRYSSD